MLSKIAATLGGAYTDACLQQLQHVAPHISLAEIRFDLPRLITHAPCPLIITCRPLREGGHFDGSEAERLDILAHAIDLGCAYVDVEWGSLGKLSRNSTKATRVIASRH